jgi:hypothetical protein
MSTEQIREFVKTKKLSLAAKWFRRESKRKSPADTQLYNNFIAQIYFPNGGILDLIESANLASRALAERRLAFCKLVFRNVLATITQCLLVCETMMCETDLSHRTWTDIPTESIPARCLTMHRKAFANEALKMIPTEQEQENGNRFPNNVDRVECRGHLLKSLIEGKLKGATQDIGELFKIIWELTQKKTFSSTERQIISAQFNDMVGTIKADVIKQIQIDQANAIESGNIQWLDPRNVIPVIDTSGSMVFANVQHIAIGLGILASLLGSMPGYLISFSERPQLFTLNLDGDVFDHFQTIMEGPTGLSTNIDATYRVLLNLMISSGTKETDFALLFLTDGQFDSQVMYERTPDHSSVSKYFSGTFLDRIKQAFRDNDYNLPRTVFWNLNGNTPGFPAATISQGAQMVSGYSQTLMFQVFTGNYKYEVQTDGSVKVNVTPWDTFLQAVMHPGYDKVSQLISSIGEGCLRHLPTKKPN